MRSNNIFKYVVTSQNVGSSVKRVLFVCVENAGRSQMAEAFARFYGEGKIEASSAGTMPAAGVNPVVAEVMREKGIDLSGNKPKLINTPMIQEADVVITMGCSAEGFCPAQLLDKVTDWKLEDPKGKPIEKVREIRDEIERRVKKLIEELA
jgi:protein-tyrosine-phosphatase